MSTEPTVAALQAETAELRSRLAQAEQALQAIRSGTVDALVVSGARGKHLLTMQDAEHSYRQLIDNLSEGVITLTSEGIILYANRRFADLLKSALELVMGSTLSQWMAPGSGGTLDALLRNRGRSELTLRARDGTRVSVLMSVTEIRTGHTTGMLGGVITDLTDLKRAQSMFDDDRLARLELLSVIEDQKATEVTLRESEQRFRTVLEQSIAGVYVVQDGHFAYVNPRFAEILGYASPDELVGSEALSVIAKSDRAKATENMLPRLAGAVQSLSYSVTAVRKDGSTLDIGLHGAAANYNGRPAIIGLMQDISEKKRAEEKDREYVEKLEDALTRTVEVATRLVEIRDPYTAGHQKKVAAIALTIGAELGLDARRLEGLRVAGYVHDIGKIAIPADILSKAGNLTPLERTLIQTHSQAGYDVLKDVQFPWPVAEITLQHHERMDGSGYPQGLKGEAILLEARILAVADVVDAMTSYRPYRASVGLDAVLAEIEGGRGTVYDVAVVDACLRLFREKGYVLPV